MQITVDTHRDTPATMRAAAAFIIAIAQSSEPAAMRAVEPAPPAPAVSASAEPDPAAVFARGVPAGTAPPPPPPPAPSTATAPAVASSAAPAADTAAPSAATVPTPASSPPPPPANHGVELDKRGLPWDARIHAGERQRNKDMTWRYKRGCPDELKSQVELELRALFPFQPPAAAVPPPPPASVPAPPAAAVPPPPPPTVPAPPTVSLPAGPPAANAAGPAGVPAAVLPGAPANAVTFATFITTMCSPAIDAGKMTQPQLLAAVKSVTGTESLGSLGQRQDLIPQVLEVLRAQGIQI